jgi:nanoRNase/pAp phosphatase (c-di-AMP/oligoRNAs hydrolase)
MRLLTRSDFDGLACGALLRELGVIDCWKFIHPKDMQDGLVEVTNEDVLANVPFVSGCKMWFDHHSSEQERLGTVEFEGESRIAPSCARVIYDYYGGKTRLPQFAEMVYFVDKVDSADLTTDEILNPSGWVLLGFIMDPRTGLGRVRNFRISNYQLMELLIEECRSKTIDEILENSDVKERTEVYFEQNELFKRMLFERTTTAGNAVITDLRGADTIYTGNRFLIYSLFPDQNISVWVVDGRNRQNVSIAVGHSVLNRTSNVDVGSLLLKFGGGGHSKVGTCQVDYDHANDVIDEIVREANAEILAAR